MAESERELVDRLLGQGLRYRAQGDRDAALAAFEAAAAIEPERLGLKVEAACELRALDRLGEAEATLEFVLALAPNTVAALVERAHLGRQRGDHERALADFDAASHTAPENISIRLEIVRSLRALDRWHEAEEQLRALAAADPGNIAVAIERGHVERQRGDRAAAVAAFAAAAAADVANSDVKLELARELAALDRLDDAEVALRAAIIANPSKLQIHLEGAELARRRGDRAGAVKALKAAIAIAPSSTASEILLQLAAELRQQGAYEAARQAIEAALAERGEDSAAEIQLGEVHRMLGQHELALAAFERAAKDDARRAEALVEVARERWRLGAPRDAAEALAEALGREPNRLAAQLLAAEFALASGQPEKAHTLAKQAIESHQGALPPYLVGARAAAESEPAEALSLLRRAEIAFRESPEIAATRIHVLRLRGDNETAGKELATAKPMITKHTGLWAEAISYAIANGDFHSAAHWLDDPPDELPRTRAYEHALRGHIAQAQRNCEAASQHFSSAIAGGGDDVEWLERLAECRLLLADVDGAKAALAASINADAARRRARRRSVNFSQHHLAQVMEEFVFDPAVLKEMQKGLALPAEQQISQFETLAQQNPDNTAPALLLLNAMRRAGRFSRASPPAEKYQATRLNPAPRRIIQYWHESEPPEDVAWLMSTWRSAHPDCEHIVLNDSSAEDRLKSYGSNEGLRAFRNANGVLQRADILRWAVLTFEGGFFPDADDRCLKPLTEYVPTNASFIAYQERLGNLGSNFVGATKSHPVILRAFARACEAVNRRDRDIPWLATGSGLLTRAFVHFFSATKGCLEDVHILDCAEWSRGVGGFMKTRYKSAG